MDQRIEGRYSDSCDLEVRTEVDGAVWSESTTTCNISPNGLCFVTSYLSRYSVGQHVDLWIGLTNASGDVDGEQREGVITWKSDDDISTVGELIRPRVGVSLLEPLEGLYDGPEI